MHRPIWFLFISFIFLISCRKDDPTPTETEMHFPSTITWESLTPTALGWDSEQLDELLTFLESHKTRAFIILKDGKIVVENYWGQNILQTGDFTQSSNWYWASAGKSLSAFLVGLAQEEGLLNIEDPTSNHLGVGWSSLTTTQETAITIKHQLTMTTGLDYNVENPDCTQTECLQYSTDPGIQWYYHNAPYTLLEGVVSSATQMSYNDYTDRLEAKIGMNGQWIQTGDNNVYYSTPRDAARFGLLVLNEGIWDGEAIMSDKAYFDEMINTSQNLNLSYGYLWWLNGKGSIIFPGASASFATSTTPDAPDELISALGKNGQFIDILPGENLVIVRMGESPENDLVPLAFHNEMWKLLIKVMK
ncbi:MAG: serine hydrolase domain-containing protein [Marinoscillum sp.]